MLTRAGLIVVVAGTVIIFIVLLTLSEAQARWKPEYAAASPEVQSWIKDQHNAAGQWCCDKSDGHPFYGGYAINADGSVTLQTAAGPRVLPPFIVLKGPNPTGHAIWWYVETGAEHIDYCFAPGTLT